VSTVRQDLTSDGSEFQVCEYANSRRKKLEKILDRGLAPPRPPLFQQGGPNPKMKPVVHPTVKIPAMPMERRVQALATVSSKVVKTPTQNIMY